MVSKVVLLFCAQALIAQCISSQCIGNGYGIADGSAWGPAGITGSWGAPYINEAPIAASWAAAPCAATPYATAEWATGFAPVASNGGGFTIKSASPIAVTGISMTSENAYEGPLSVAGAVPFLAAVALEGALPTAGSGAITYGCGSGNVAMLSEGINAGPFGYGAGVTGELGYGYGPIGYEAGITGPGYGYGYNRGCGCSGAIY
ncbi:chorion class B protein PC10-like [Pararge aegeria]|uniref:Jg18782 protein n=2 Tax=Pararge aegeria TaxID=116150 RepID=A0A8S4S3U9_9NEOP|nr:chorion class B protein PC10-like [Pararge aegeria]CAH2249563.1 jg18782 [Pararge aegeria aegeria]